MKLARPLTLRAQRTRECGGDYFIGLSSSLSFRVSVFRPHPNSYAASAFFPPECSKAASIMIDSNKGSA